MKRFLSSRNKHIYYDKIPKKNIYWEMMSISFQFQCIKSFYTLHANNNTISNSSSDWHFIADITIYIYAACFYASKLKHTNFPQSPCIPFITKFLMLNNRWNKRFFISKEVHMYLKNAKQLSAKSHSIIHRNITYNFFKYDHIALLTYHTS